MNVITCSEVTNDCMNVTTVYILLNFEKEQETIAWKKDILLGSTLWVYPYVQETAQGIGNTLRVSLCTREMEQGIGNENICWERW